MNNPSYVIIHHSETKDGVTQDWDAIRKFHKDVRGWSDIGYHYGIERVGTEITLQFGRKPDVVGAHCKEGGLNSKSIGVCVVGNFDFMAPDEGLLAILRMLTLSIMDTYEIPANRVLGHKEAQVMAIGQALKTCPGRNFDMDAFRASLEDKDEPIKAV